MSVVKGNYAERLSGRGAREAEIMCEEVLSFQGAKKKIEWTLLPLLSPVSTDVMARAEATVLSS